MDPSTEIGERTPAQAMTPALLARLFVVPALVVCVLLGVAVVVVLFGASSLEKQATVAELLDTLESDAGDRGLMGMGFWPNDRSYWQAAEDLARYLENRDKYLKPEEIEPTAQRIIDILGAKRAARSTEETGPGANQQYFLMHALARLETPTAIEPLVQMISDQDWRTRMEAVRGLAVLHRLPEARRRVPDVLNLLRDPEPQVRMVACAALVSLAEEGDPRVIRALAAGLEAPELEVQWNAATSLARLGSPRGKLVLMNMLDRAYWENLRLDYVERDSRVLRQLTQQEVARYLSAAIEAAAHLRDADLSALIDRLQSDQAVLVREAARKAANGETASAGGWGFERLGWPRFDDGARVPAEFA